MLKLAVIERHPLAAVPAPAELPDSRGLLGAKESSSDPPRRRPGPGRVAEWRALAVIERLPLRRPGPAEPPGGARSPSSTDHRSPPPRPRLSRRVARSPSSSDPHRRRPDPGRATRRCSALARRHRATPLAAVPAPADPPGSARSPTSSDPRRRRPGPDRAAGWRALVVIEHFCLRPGPGCLVEWRLLAVIKPHLCLP